MTSPLIARIESALGKLLKVYNPDQLELDIVRLTQKIEANPSDWRIAQELARMSQQFQSFTDISRHYTNLREYAGEVGEDDSLVAEGATLLAHISDLLLEQKFSGPYAHESALITLQRGEGGRSLDDFVRNLVGAYASFARQKNFQPELLSSNGEIVLQVIGENSFGFFRGEHGVHKCT